MIKLFSKKEDETNVKDTVVADAVSDKKEVSSKITTKKKVAKKEAPLNKTSTKKSSTVATGKENIARVLINPRMTEKATLGIERNVYVFDVVKDANKKQIKEAIKLIYNVNPVKIRVTTIAKKNSKNPRTGIKGVKGGGKKASVYLKKGDKITIM